MVDSKNAKKVRESFKEKDQSKILNAPLKLGTTFQMYACLCIPAVIIMDNEQARKVFMDLESRIPQLLADKEWIFLSVKKNTFKIPVTLFE